VRFVAENRVLRAGTALPGRGAYTCRNLECFEQARTQNGFRRSLRHAVVVEPELGRLYTEVSHG